MLVDRKVSETEETGFDVATVAFQGARSYQEDSIISNFPVGQPTGFCVLADGMGGHEAGNVASALVMSEVFAQLKMNETAMAKNATGIPALLRCMAIDANARITEHNEKDEETYGMGSTLLATVIRHDKLYWVSVGDSPLFLFRDGVLSQLNKDHSMAPQIDMMVKVGAMTEEVGRNHPDRNTLTSAISGQDIAMIDCPSEPTILQSGDIIIASSDGLQFISNEDITATLKKVADRPSLEIANALLNDIKTLDDPDQDNTAFAVVKLDEVAAEADNESRTVIPLSAAQGKSENIVLDESEPEDFEMDDAVDEVGEIEKENIFAEDSSSDEKAPKHKVIVIEDEPVAPATDAMTDVEETNDSSYETVNVAPIEKNGRRTIKVVKASEPRPRFIPKRPSDPDYVEDDDAQASAPDWYRKEKRFKD